MLRKLPRPPAIYYPFADLPAVSALEADPGAPDRDRGGNPAEAGIPVLRFPAAAGMAPGERKSETRFILRRIRPRTGLSRPATS